MKPFSYETTRRNVMYCVENEDIKGIVIYKFTKPNYVFNCEKEIVRQVFNSHELDYEEIPVYNEKYGEGYSFIIIGRE